MTPLKKKVAATRHIKLPSNATAETLKAADGRRAGIYSWKI